MVVVVAVVVTFGLTEWMIIRINDVGLGNAKVIEISD